MSRVVRQYRSDNKETYKAFCEKYPEIHLSIKMWRKLLYIINHAYRDYVLETGEMVKLPYGFGCITINKKKSIGAFIDKKTGLERTSLPINWERTRAKGKVIFNFNDHTDGYYYGWIYIPSTGRIKFRKLWKFKACRESSRLLAKYLKMPDGKYKYLYREYPSYRK